MDIFGIGPLEFLFVLIIALVVLGPRGVVKYAQQAGTFIRRVVQSPAWRAMIDSSREINKARDQFMQESGLKDSLRDVERDVIRNTTGINHTIWSIDSGTSVKTDQLINISPTDAKEPEQKPGANDPGS